MTVLTTHPEWLVNLTYVSGFISVKHVCADPNLGSICRGDLLHLDALGDQDGIPAFLSPVCHYEDFQEYYLRHHGTKHGLRHHHMVDLRPSM